LKTLGFWDLILGGNQEFNLLLSKISGGPVPKSLLY
jgi:hypothetical protein